MINGSVMGENREHVDTCPLVMTNSLRTGTSPCLRTVDHRTKRAIRTRAILNYPHGSFATYE